MPKPTGKKRHSCIVIGAGLSGLVAAYELVKEGWEVTILEATPRTGGRVYSYRFPGAPELNCELGGEWVGLDHDTMIGLCTEFNLKLIPHRFDFSFFLNGKHGKQFRAGEWPFSKKALRAYNDLKDQVKLWSSNGRQGARKNRVLDNKDWWTILRDRGFTDEELVNRDLMDSTDFGETIRMSGGYSAAAEYFDSDRFDEMDFKIEGGNIRLVHALAGAVKKLKGQIVTRRHVTQIQQSGTRIKVITSNRESKSADFCICTVPARTLTKIKFDPPLPDMQWDAAKQLQYCRIMKTAILCDKRTWLKDPCSGISWFTDRTSDFLFDATLGQPGEKGILCSYSIGDKADDLADLPEDRLQEKLNQDMGDLLEKRKPTILKVKKQAWQKDNLTEGAYAFYRPGQWFTVRKLLAQPYKRVYFAGEHIADEQGFMEGAVDTGGIAARAVPRAARGPRRKSR